MQIMIHTRMYIPIQNVRFIFKLNSCMYLRLRKFTGRISIFYYWYLRAREQSNILEFSFILCRNILCKYGFN